MQVTERAKLGNELLALWSRHPEAKFTLDTIVYCLNWRKLDVKRALISLEQEDLVRQENKDGVIFYSLAFWGDGPKR